MPPKNKNVKVVVTLAREKISSPDPVDLKSQETATLRIIWSIAEWHLVLLITIMGRNVNQKSGAKFDGSPYRFNQ